MRLIRLLFLLPIWLLSVTVVGANPVKEVKRWTITNRDRQVGELASQPFARKALSKSDAEAITVELETHYRNRVVKELEDSWKNNLFQTGEYTLPIAYKVYGEEPADGRSLYISMHGGGHTAKQVNDGQWENQKRLYRPVEGVYVAPRAAVDDWNMWHQPHVDVLFEQIIRAAVALQQVNPNKVYVMGYSAGGDGTFQLAPRLADHWAAAAMMAGHPGDARPENLRNIGFSIWMGGEDAAYNRNGLAADWEKWLAQYREKDSDGYNHEVHILSGKGHWMERQDTLALDYMKRFVRNPYPDKVVWMQDDVLRPAFYWLSVPLISAQAGQMIEAQYRNNTITVLKNDSSELTIWLNDEMVDLDRPVEVVYNGKSIYKGKVKRTVAALARSLQERGDISYAFPAFIQVKNGVAVTGK